MGRKKRHHYLNQSYLRGFTTDAEHKELWLYDRQTGKVRCSSPRDAFNICDLYTFKKGDKDDSESLENLLADVESAISPALSKLVSRVVLSKEELSHIYSLIALCMVRVPSSLEAGENIARATVLATMKILEDRGEIPPCPGDGAWAGRKMTELVQEGKINVDILPNMPLSLMGSFGDLAEKIAKLNFCILRATENLSFVTADVPVVMYEPVLYRAFPFRGLANEYVELTFPISNRLCFLATWVKLPSGFVSVRNEVVRQVILRHCFFANRFVAYHAKSGFVENAIKQCAGLGVETTVRNESSTTERGIYTIATRSFRSDASNEFYTTKFAPILRSRLPQGNLHTSDE